jgi:beta-aspartyl-peptidase (threonine type)
MSKQVWSRGGRVSGFAVLVHGGAGSVPEARREAHAEGCRRAARVAGALLREGAGALEAAEAAVRALEDDPLFNAGTGACLNAEGHIEHDASIMEGTALRAGAVCALEGFATPIAIARAALEDGRHLLYAGAGARAFALRGGFVPVAEELLITPAARAAFEAARAEPGAVGWAGGTVGAVVADARGHLAAATSTGGMVNKSPGRVGDSPLIGAGTYADDEAGAVSTTGHGEGMIRLGAARIAAVAMGGESSAEEASRVVITKLFDKLAATGGMISIDHRGRWGWARSTETMSWALVTAEGEEGGV